MFCLPRISACFQFNVHILHLRCNIRNKVAAQVEIIEDNNGIFICFRRFFLEETQVIPVGFSRETIVILLELGLDDGGEVLVLFVIM